MVWRNCVVANGSIKWRYNITCDVEKMSLRKLLETESMAMYHTRSAGSASSIIIIIIIIIVLLAFKTHLGVFSLLSLEVSRSHTRTHHSR